MNALELSLAIIKRFEGLRLRPYLCSAGVPTIGYGATYYENGQAVTLFDAPITKERAEQLLLWHTKTVYMPAVMRMCPGLTDAHKAAAIIDFTFNLGTGRLKASTLRKRINAQDWEGAKTELMKWTRGGGKVLKGLVIRRQAECNLIDA